MLTSKRVTSVGAPASMSRRYLRAVAWTAPKIAARTPGIAVEGYWLEESRYYFLAERFDASLGRMIEVPSIADCNTHSIKEVMPLQDLAMLLSRESTADVTLDMLTFGEFATRDLAVTECKDDQFVTPSGGIA